MIYLYFFVFRTGTSFSFICLLTCLLVLLIIPLLGLRALLEYVMYFIFGNWLMFGDFFVVFDRRIGEYCYGLHGCIVGHCSKFSLIRFVFCCCFVYYSGLIYLFFCTCWRKITVFISCGRLSIIYFLL